MSVNGSIIFQNHCSIVDRRRPVSPVTSIANLGIFIDFDLVMRTQVRSKNRDRMLRCIASDPQLGADGHVPVIGGRSGDIQTRLRKRCADRSYGRHTWFAARSRCRMQMILKLRRFCHITHALFSLHWLRASRSASSTRSPY